MTAIATSEKEEHKFVGEQRGVLGRFWREDK